jgi:methylmalonyl-CoA mutase cobalamin-binding domain/chain
MGYDSDHPRAQGEVGKVGVAIDSIEDMEILLRRASRSDKVSTSMTINSTAAILLALYHRGGARSRASAPAKLSGTIQNDMLKEYVARGTYIYPPRPSMRIITDIFAYTARVMSRVEHHLHLRLPTSARPARPAVQEVAFTLADGIAYVEAARRGRARRGRVRPAPRLLLQRPQQRARGGGQVPRRAPPLGTDHEGPLRGQAIPAPRCSASTPRPPARTLTAQQPRRTTSCG